MVEAVFDIDVNASDGLNFQWMKGDEELKDQEGKYSGCKDRCLLIQDVKSTDVGDYLCKVWRGDDQSSEEVSERAKLSLGEY